MLDMQEAQGFIINAGRYAEITNEKLPPGLSSDDVITRMRANVALCRTLMTDNNKFIDAYLAPIFKEPENISNDDAVKLLDFARSLHHPIYSNEDERKKLDSFLALDIYSALVKWADKVQENELLIKGWFGIGDIYYLLSGSLYSPDSVTATKKAMELVAQSGGYLALNDKNAHLCAAACYNQLAISTYNSREAGYEEKFNAIDDALAFYNRDDVRALDSDSPCQSWIDDV